MSKRVVTRFGSIVVLVLGMVESFPVLWAFKNGKLQTATNSRERVDRNDDIHAKTSSSREQRQWMSQRLLSSQPLSTIENEAATVATTRATESANTALLPLTRAWEISSVLWNKFIIHMIASLIEHEGRLPTDWETFWSLTSSDNSSSNNNNNNNTATNAEQLVMAIQELGPTYVKFGQALSSRPDIVPKSLRDALCTLQDSMEPFDSQLAQQLIISEWKTTASSGSSLIDHNDTRQALLQSLSKTPVAAASIGQVYTGYLPHYGKVAVKVKRPGIQGLVERDTQLLLSVAKFLESIPAVAVNNQDRLIASELVSAVDEFMSRIREELDYRQEAKNAETFASLYSIRNGNSSSIRVVVPEIISSLCTENVLVMEWIEGTKLTDTTTTTTTNEEEEKKTSLDLIVLGIQCTLSQLLETGIMHADPHDGNLLKVLDYNSDDSFNSAKKSSSSSSSSSVQLGYLDFGLLSYIPESVRDGLVCAVVQLVFAKNVKAVANLFGDLDLLPPHVMEDPQEVKALTKALNETLNQVLVLPDASCSTSTTTSIPSLRFDKLLDGLTRLVPRFQFQLPPYFINNARALATLEGTARSLDPSFNVLQVLYPYAIARLLQNPNQRGILDTTLQDLITCRETNRMTISKLRQLVQDIVDLTGYSRRQVIRDVLETRAGRRLSRKVVWEEFKFLVVPTKKNQKQPRSSRIARFLRL